MSKVWLITGSSRGLGYALAKAALAAGDMVVATARQPEQLEDLVQEYGPGVRTTPLDVTDVEAAKRAVKVAVDTFGSLDVVVNNAGYGISAPIEEMSEDDFRAQMEVNFFGVVNVTRAALPVLHQQRSGHFVQFSSIAGRSSGTPGMSGYQTAKYAVEGFSEVLHAETKSLGIKVTIVEPGRFRTDWGGSSMRHLPIGGDYETTVGEMNRRRELTVAKWPGDPARAAKIIVDLTSLEEPPLRLLLGAGAVETARERSRALAVEVEDWVDVSRSADFPEGE